MAKLSSTLTSIFLLALGTLVLESCGEKAVFEKNAKIEDHTWSLNDTLSFIFNIIDTSQYYDINVNVRSGGLYEYSNIYLFLKIEAPNGSQLEDKMQIILADNMGKWYGKGLGDIKFLSSPYRSHVKFIMPGIYKLSMVHGMRTNELDHIFDMGIKVSIADSLDTAKNNNQ